MNHYKAGSQQDSVTLTGEWMQPLLSQQLDMMSYIKVEHVIKNLWVHWQAASLAYDLHMCWETLGCDCPSGWTTVSSFPHGASAGIHRPAFVYVEANAIKLHTTFMEGGVGVCQPYQTQLFPPKSDTYASTKKVISHQLKSATTESAIRCCRPFQFLPAALTMWYNEVRRKLSMMIIMAVSVFSRDKVKKSTLHDSGTSIGKNSLE